MPVLRLFLHAQTSGELTRSIKCGISSNNRINEELFSALKNRIILFKEWENTAYFNKITTRFMIMFLEPQK